MSVKNKLRVYWYAFEQYLLIRIKTEKTKQMIDSTEGTVVMERNRESQ
jgi:hypothetical protein